jgi:hypothetical protein
MPAKEWEFKSGDKVVCDSSHVAKDFEWYPAQDCGYQRSDLPHMGLYYMGVYKSVSFKGAEGVTTKKRYGKLPTIEFEFTPLKGCDDTVHECSAPEGDEGFTPLQCSTRCEI